MPKKLFLILFFACFGVATEICFVAIMNLINQTPICGKSLWTLTGKTYVWMLPIYGLIPILAAPLVGRAAHLVLGVRLMLYAVIITGVEFIAGAILEWITGSCPWEYTTGWHVMGYIRLDYFPAWMFFAFLIEYLYNYLDKNLTT